MTAGNRDEGEFILPIMSTGFMYVSPVNYCLPWREKGLTSAYCPSLDGRGRRVQ
jgi:hypothetical protein